jgi:hypothetical protein
MKKVSKDQVSSSGGRALVEKLGVEHMRCIGRSGALKRKVHGGGRPRALTYAQLVKTGPALHPELNQAASIEKMMTLLKKSPIAGWLNIHTST